MLTEKQSLKILRENQDVLIIIHLSCQTMNGLNEGYSSPRITAIVTLRVGTESANSFSMHLVAEEMGIPKEKITDRYEEIELKMLEKFFNYANSNKNCYWLHWNMRDSSYGFQAIQHRYRVLSKKEPPDLPEERRICLPTVLKSVYGSNYANHPRMYRLMELNGGQHRHVLNGEQESEYFGEKKYFEMHQSTIAKVYFFKSVVFKLLKGNLKTDSNNIKYILQELKDHPIFSVLSIISLLFGTYKIGEFLYSLI